MANSHFTKLAYAEGWGHVDVCRHGTVYLLWRNVTVRLTIDRFQRLVTLLDQGSSLSDPTSPLCDGELCLALQGADYRLSIGSLDLTLAADAFLVMMVLVREARQQLETLLASEAWGQPPAVPRLDFDLDEVLQPHRFSLS